ncbi:MAG: hypothetical protein AB7U29_08535 [Desulfobulbus sp.]
MKAVRQIKRVQVEGKQYLMPAEDADIEKLIQKGLRLKSKVDAMQGELDSVHARLIEIAHARREGTTTVSLQGVSAKAVVTFRESFSVGKGIEDIAVPLGPLFKRFFSKSTSYKTTADFKKFMQSGHALGIQNADEVKATMEKYVTVKETKPNVKIDPE